MSSYARSPTGLRSPPPPRSAAASPRPKFDSESLRTYMKKLLLSTFQGTVWPDPKDQNDRIRAWNKEINERVKERMVEIQSHGYKYVVLTQVTQNLGQGGRIDMVSHWDETDIVAKEIFYNVRPTRFPILDSAVAPDIIRSFSGLVSLHVHRTSNLMIIPPAATPIIGLCVSMLTNVRARR